MKNLMISLGIIVILLITPVYADGCYMSDEILHLYLPDQKAVISWDGYTEEMIIASSVKSDKILKLAWVVPIQSTTKPEIEAADIAIFEDLVEFFKEPRPEGLFGKGRNLEATGAGVELIETKEIDIYDIAILKADDSQALLDWLNTNDYAVPIEAKPIFDKYVTYGNLYFIANKIDLKNKHARAISLLPAALENAKQEVTTKREEIFNQAQEKYSLLGYTIDENNDDSNFYTKERQKFIENKLKRIFAAEGSNAWVKDIGYSKQLIIDNEWIITWDSGSRRRPLFFRIQVSYRYTSNHQTPLYTDFYPRRDYQTGAEENKELGTEKLQKAKHYAEVVKEVLSEYHNTLDDINTITWDDFEYYRLLQRLNKDDFNFVCQGNYYSLNEEFVNSLMKYEGEDFVALCENNFALQQGMATPLKFSFTPATPYYPLEISSLGKGYTTVDVYVLYERPVTDTNNLMTETKSKKITPEIKEKLSNHITIGNSKYITRLTWRGNLKELITDARFTEGAEEPTTDITYEEKYSFLEKIFNWVSSFF